MAATLLSQPACALCGKLAEMRPTCLLLPGADPLCWECASDLEGSVVGQGRGPVLLYRPARPFSHRLAARDEEEEAFMLSAREQEVVQLVVSGLTNLEIAARLHRSKSTIAKHVSHALAKRGARNRAELVATTLRSGFGEPARAPRAAAPGS